MSTSKKSLQRREEPLELKDALAAVIANTRRNKRRLNLIQIAGKIAIARKHLSKKEIADRVMLSTEMIREFERVDKLAGPLKNLVQNGTITSVDEAYRLSRLSVDDQRFLANEMVKGKLNSKDLRAIVSLKKSNPRLAIRNVIQKIKDSRNIKEFVAEFMVPYTQSDQSHKTEESLRTFFGTDHIKSISIQNGKVRAVFDSIGGERLMKMARQKRLTKREVLLLIASAQTQGGVS
jgi:hypothetical protein